MSLIWAVQVAMVARLKADVPLEALLGDRIYDGKAPDGAALPYVVVGDSTENAVRALGASGGDTTITAHVFSDYSGTKQALAIAAAMKAALSSALTLSGYGAARLKQEFVTTLVEEDETKVLRHVPVRYRIASLAT